MGIAETATIIPLTKSGSPLTQKKFTWDYNYNVHDIIKQLYIPLKIEYILNLNVIADYFCLSNTINTFNYSAVYSPYP